MSRILHPTPPLAAPDHAYGLFFEACPLPALVLDADTLDILAANEEAEQMYGYARGELTGMSYRRLGMEGPPPLDGRAKHRRHDGTACTVETISRSTRHEGRLLKLLTVIPAPDFPGTGEDTQFRSRVLEMIARNEPLDATLAQVMGLIERACAGSLPQAMLLREGKLYHAGGAALPEMLVEALDGLPIEATRQSSEKVSPCWAPPGSVIDTSYDLRWLPWRGLAQETGMACCWPEAIVSAAGEVLGVVLAWLREVRSPTAEERATMQLAGHMAGIAIEQRNLMADLAYQARHDPVTRLPNRHLMEQRLEEAIAAAERSGRNLALLHVDLDRFQKVNDLLGRQIGDVLLEQVARRLEPVLRAGDTLARETGDDFAVVLRGVLNETGARTAAERLRRTFAEPFLIGGHELTVSTSIGMALYPEHGADVSSLERNAETAMYAAKRRGRNCIETFRPAMNTHTHQRLVIESYLGRALARGELAVLYQPQVELTTGRLAGAEALLRWRHPEIGLVSPGTFIPIAEESGLIVPIGAWVLQQACREATRWERPGIHPLHIAVNVSVVQFSREDMLPVVEAALQEAQLPASRLELELTESTLAQDMAQTAKQMDALRALGVRISMDDFGTGYSSLAYLRNLPVDCIKIDKVFVQQIAAASDRPPLIKSIITMTHALGKKVVAEGVETAEQRDALIAMECDLGQGFLWSPAVDPNVFLEQWVERSSVAAPTTGQVSLP